MAAISEEALRQHIAHVLHGSDNKVKEQAISLLSSTIGHLAQDNQLDILKTFEVYLHEISPSADVAALKHCTSRNDPSVVRCRCIRSILSGIFIMLDTRGSDVNQGIKDSIRAMWPSLWIWMHEVFLVRPSIPPPFPGVIIQEIYDAPYDKGIDAVLSACLSITSMDMDVTNPNSMLHYMGDTPGFVRCIAMWWEASVKVPSSILSYSVPANYLMDLLLAVPDKPWMVEVESAAGSAAKFVSVIIYHVSGLMSPDRVYFLEPIMRIMCHPLTQEIHQRLLAADTVMTVIRLIEILSGSEQFGHHAIQSLMHVCLQYLVNVFNGPDGQGEMQTAFKSDIVFSLAAAAVSTHLCSPDPDFVQVCLRLLQVLQPQLVFRSNLRGVKKSFHMMQITHKHVEWLDPTIDAAWRQFDAMSSALALSEKTYVAGFGKECTACGKNDTEVVLLKCSKCGVYYCSRMCQVKDWKEGHHREVCRPGLLRDRNGRFITHLVCDLLRQCDKNMALMFQKYVLLHDGDTPPVFHIEVNCSVYPRTIGGWVTSPSSGRPQHIVPGDRTKCAKISAVLPTYGDQTIKEDVPYAAKHFPEPAYYSRNEFLAQGADGVDDSERIAKEIERIDATLKTAHQNLKLPTMYYWLDA